MDQKLTDALMAARDALETANMNLQATQDRAERGEISHEIADALRAYADHALADMLGAVVAVAIAAGHISPLPSWEA